MIAGVAPRDGAVQGRRNRTGARRVLAGEARYGSRRRGAL